MVRERRVGGGGFGPRLLPSCSLRARSSLDAHLEALGTAHDRRAPVAGLGPRERNPLDSRRSGCDQAGRLHAREFGADALVHSMPERRVLVETTAELAAHQRLGRASRLRAHRAHEAAADRVRARGGGVPAGRNDHRADRDRRTERRITARQDFGTRGARYDPTTVTGETPERARTACHQIGCNGLRAEAKWGVAVAVSREAVGNAAERPSSFRVRRRTSSDG